MEIDYKCLCKELFGTDDIEELRKKAELLKKKNSRNAGRKKKLSYEEINKIKKDLSKGLSVNDLAKKYNTSRQIITKSITEPLNKDYPLRIQYLYKNKICTQIDVDFLNEKIKIENRTDDILHRAFGIKENPDWDDFKWFLSERCFPKTRSGVKGILKELNIDCYDTLQIVEKTEGRMVDDNMYLKFKYYNKGV